jgi:hypothetical protein
MLVPMRRGDAKSVGFELHRLALRYWSDGRLADARRVALEVRYLIDSCRADRRLREDVDDLLDALEAQLQRSARSRGAGSREGDAD